MSGQSRQPAAVMLTASKPLIELIELLIGSIEKK
jgi:hypothetical protein